MRKTKDGEDDIEPCYEDASITAYSLNKEEFKSQYNEMLSQLKCALDSENDGGKDMDQDKLDQLEEEVVETVEEPEADFTEEQKTEEEVTEDNTESEETEKVETEPETEEEFTDETPEEERQKDRP